MWSKHDLRSEMAGGNTLYNRTHLNLSCEEENPFIINIRYILHSKVINSCLKNYYFVRELPQDFRMSLVQVMWMLATTDSESGVLNSAKISEGYFLFFK